ncbi:MAG TPA: MFS transporter [Dehalococcoidales bacterium]|nr:MFS transporter [Dehalococcoidales bacterium]
MSNQELQQRPETSPGLFYGFVVVGVAFFIMMVAWAVYNSFGVFFKPLLTEFRWTSAMTSGAFSLSMIIYGVLGIIVGGLTDRFGPRVVVTFCGVLLGLGYLLMSQTATLWQLYLFYGVIIGVGMSGVWVPQLSTIARWFTRRRTLMTGIVIAGGGIGQLIGPPVITRLIEAYDWRWSFAILGGVVLILVVLAAQFMKRSPARLEQLPNVGHENEPLGPASGTDFRLREAVSTPQFWMLFFIFVCYGYGFFSIIVHIVPHAIELEISAAGAAGILAAMGGAGILGNYVLGVVADKSGNRLIFMMGCLVMSATLFWLVYISEMWMLYIFILLFGFVFGGMGAAESPLVARLFGLTSHGLIYGVVHLGFTVGAAAGPFFSGYLFDITASYRTAFLVGAAFGVVGLVLSVILTPTRRLGGSI